MVVLRKLRNKPPGHYQEVSVWGKRATRPKSKANIPNRDQPLADLKLQDHQLAAVKVENHLQEKEVAVIKLPAVHPQTRDPPEVRPARMIRICQLQATRQAFQILPIRIKRNRNNKRIQRIHPVETLVHCHRQAQLRLTLSLELQNSRKQWGRKRRHRVQQASPPRVFHRSNPLLSRQSSLLWRPR